MDNCFIDVTMEFLNVAFHSILYYTSIYPQSIFECRRKYNTVVYRSIHPEVNQYLELCMKTIVECLKSAQLSCVEFTITDMEYKPVLKFVFQFDKNNCYEETIDAYLIQAELNLRAFCLKLSSMSSSFKDLPEEATFTIHMHTNESTAVSMAANPELEAFPLIEVNENLEDSSNKIIPLRHFSIRDHNIDTYLVIK